MPNSPVPAEVSSEAWAALATRLREAEEKLATFERRNDEFLAMLAHELRDPLAPILSAVEIMRAIGSHDATLDKSCELIARQVDRLSATVDELLARHTANFERPPVPATGHEMPRRILVIDDNRDAAESVAMLLRLKGHDVHIAYDGNMGVSAALEMACDCVIVDIGLPGIDGYEVARRLRSHDRDHPLMLIALTGYGQPEDIMRSAEAGFDHHLVKPVAQEVLESLIRRR